VARESCGGRNAQLLTAISTAVTLLADGSELSPDAFDKLWWTPLTYVVTRLVRRGELNLWVCGHRRGVSDSRSSQCSFFAGALSLAFLAIPSERRYLRSRWLGVPEMVCISPIFTAPSAEWATVKQYDQIR
jgi:hypothetical protein